MTLPDGGAVATHVRIASDSTSAGFLPVAAATPVPAAAPTPAPMAAPLPPPAIAPMMAPVASHGKPYSGNAGLTEVHVHGFRAGHEFCVGLYGEGAREQVFVPLDEEA